MRLPPFGPRAVLGFVVGVSCALAADAAFADADQARWIEWHRRRAVRLEAEGRRPEAVEDWRALVSLEPADSAVAVRAAVAMVNVICDPPAEPKRTDPTYMAAEQLIREAVRRGAVHDPSLAFAIGRLRFADGNYKDAQDMLGFARRRGYDPARARLWHGRAVVSDTLRLLDKGDSDEAIRRLERLLKDDPDHPDAPAAKINLATSYSRRGEHVLAERILTDLIAASPWNARAHLVLGQTYMALSRFDEAAASFRTAMDRAQEREDGIYTGRAIHSDALLAAATMELRRGELETCQSQAEQFLQIQRDSPDGIYLLGMVALRRGGKDNLLEAARLLRKANRLAPKTKVVLANLVQTLSELGEAEESQTFQKELDAIQQAERETAEKKLRPSRGNAPLPGGVTPPVTPPVTPASGTPK